MIILLISTIADFAKDGLSTWLIVAVMLFLLGLAKFLDFPWVVPYLEKWLELAYDAVHRKMLKETPVKVEPPELPDQRE